MPDNQAPHQPFGAAPPYDYFAMLERALEPLDVTQTAGLLAVLRRLLMLVFADYVEAEAGNPVDHHLFVLRHMVSIACFEKYSDTELLRAAAIAMLHDVAPVEKIPRGRVAELTIRDPKAGEALEVRRKSNRTLHMREGSAMAQKRLLQLNHSFSEVVFSEEDIEVICEVIRIHDNPSIDIPIPTTMAGLSSRMAQIYKLAAAFREADRLWMITIRGVYVDIEREAKSLEDPELFRKQLEANLERFRDERKLYSESDGPFQDEEMFFRTAGGYTLLQNLLSEI